MSCSYDVLHSSPRTTSTPSCRCRKMSPEACTLQNERYLQHRCRMPFCSLHRRSNIRTVRQRKPGIHQKMRRHRVVIRHGGHRQTTVSRYMLGVLCRSVLVYPSSCIQLVHDSAPDRVCEVDLASAPVRLEAQPPPRGATVQRRSKRGRFHEPNAWYRGRTLSLYNDVRCSINLKHAPHAVERHRGGW